MTQYVNAHNDEALTASSLSAIAAALSQLAITQAAILERLPVPPAESTGAGTNTLQSDVSAVVVATTSQAGDVPDSPSTVEAGIVPPQPAEIVVISESESESESESDFESEVFAADSTGLSESTVEARAVPSQTFETSVLRESEDNVASAVSTSSNESAIEATAAPSEAVRASVLPASEDNIGSVVTTVSRAPPSYSGSATGAPPSYPGSSGHAMPTVGVALPIAVAPVTPGNTNDSDSDSDPGSESDSEASRIPPTPDEVAASLVGVPPPPDGKWYVVTAGKAPGVYSDWDETATYVNKVSGAVFKKYPTKTDALWRYKCAYAAGRVRVIM